LSMASPESWRPRNQDRVFPSFEEYGDLVGQAFVDGNYGFGNAGAADWAGKKFARIYLNGLTHKQITLDKLTNVTVINNAGYDFVAVHPKSSLLVVVVRPRTTAYVYPWYQVPGPAALVRNNVKIYKAAGVKVVNLTYNNPKKCILGKIQTVGGKRLRVEIIDEAKK